MLTEMTTAERIDGGCLLQFEREKKSEQYRQASPYSGEKQQRYLKQTDLTHLYYSLGPYSAYNL